jgi:hypothetical protein
MKILSKSLLLGLWALFAPVTALAHNASQLPFLQVNGKDATVYPVGSTSLVNFTLPQDSAPEAYIAHTPVRLNLETVNLPILPEYISKTTFKWDFGDGSTALGLTQVHTWSKIGSYIINITSASNEDVAPPQLLDAVFINIVPGKEYRLPESKFSLNGKQSSNPYTDILKANLHQTVYFKSLSSKGSAPIAHYFWDFGDQKTSTTSSDTHIYDSRLEYVLPLLRVTDVNGFFSDQLVQIENDPKALVPTPEPLTTPQQTNSSGVFMIIVAIGILGLISYLLLKVRAARK